MWRFLISSQITPLDEQKKKRTFAEIGGQIVSSGGQKKFYFFYRVCKTVLPIGGRLVTLAVRRSALTKGGNSYVKFTSAHALEIEDCQLKIGIRAIR